MGVFLVNVLVPDEISTVSADSGPQCSCHASGHEARVPHDRGARGTGAHEILVSASRPPIARRSTISRTPPPPPPRRKRRDDAG